MENNVSDNRLCELLLGRINDKNDQIDLLNRCIDEKNERIKELQEKLEEYTNKNKDIQFSFDVTYEDVKKINEWVKTHLHDSDERKYVKYEFQFNGGGQSDYTGTVVCSCGKDFCFRGKLDARNDFK
jgi:uncharacterized protein with ParB-like and HNH nuclease domain